MTETAASHLKVDVIVERDKVLVLMSRRVDWFKLTPDQAREMAADLMTKAARADKLEKKE